MDAADRFRPTAKLYRRQLGGVRSRSISFGRIGDHQAKIIIRRTIIGVEMTTQTQEAKDKYIFRGTNKQKGRTNAISPENSLMKHLAYGRIMLDKEVPSAEFQSAEREIGLICMSGNCSIDVDGEQKRIDQYDSIYIPRDSTVRISTDSSVDLAECSAEVEN